MTAEQPKPRVLIIGLDPHRVPGPWDPEPVAEAIRDGFTEFAKHGVQAQACLFGLDGSDNPEDVIGTVLQSQPWECVVIGGGVRTDDNLLDLFERIINLVRRLAPGAAIAFNASPTETYAAASRWIDVGDDR